MLTEKIIGREEEINRLKACRNSKEPELVIVYGRRRVGKTFLIRRSFNNRFEFSFVGAYNKSTKVQLENFAMALQEQSGLERPIPKTWAHAFRQLREHLQQNAKKQKSVVFFMAYGLKGTHCPHPPDKCTVVTIGIPIGIKVPFQLTG